ncbi:hypothetical protein [Ochrovirga pacifica]|uniref:hypothetical protein n=1 Tax=Ochrovirga pacifica TaxID=1042376 RepID=UPI00025583DB|nr:hypothetical protein [Ochrovirga pacifica]
MKKWTCVFKHPWVYRVEVAKYDIDVILISTLANRNIEGKNAGTYLSKDGGKKLEENKQRKWSVR